MSDYAINVKTRIRINGLSQSIHVLGRRADNPLLLVLHGGPGIVNRHTVIEDHADLAERFILVAWDQRGAGGSYWGTRRESLTVATFVEDAYLLIGHLLAQYGKKKAFVLGGSWGTELGIRLILAHPEVVEAFVGYGQVVDGFENEERNYAFALARAQEEGSRKDIRTLERLGPPVEGCYRPVFKGLVRQRKLLARYGGNNLARRSFWASTVRPVLRSAEYSLSDKLGAFLGYSFVLRHSWKEVVRYDFRAEARRLEVPIYIFQGRFDNTTPSALVEEYFKLLEAPRKELIWFKHSAHGPFGEEKELFHRLLEEKLLGSLPRYPGGSSISA